VVQVLFIYGLLICSPFSLLRIYYYTFRPPVLLGRADREAVPDRIGQHDVRTSLVHVANGIHLMFQDKLHAT
jgi:hypothetical protein